jgi:hypothetical protein
MHSRAHQRSGLSRRTLWPPSSRHACSSSPQRLQHSTCACALVQVDRALVKNVLDIYIRVGMDSMDAYEADFEADLLSTTATFYKRKVRLGGDGVTAPTHAASCTRSMHKLWCLGRTEKPAVASLLRLLLLLLLLLWWRELSGGDTLEEG